MKIIYKGFKKKKSIILAIMTSLVILVLTVSCANQKQSKKQAGVRLPAPVLFVGIDGSGSYNFLEQGKVGLKTLIDSLPATSTVIVRHISSDSYLDSNVIITKTLSGEKEKGEIVFNKQKRIARIKSQLAVKREKEEIWNAILNAKSIKSRFTDLYGFFLVVSERIGVYKDESRSVYMVILSDMKNTREKYEKWMKKGCLSGVRVYILAFENSSPAMKRQWIDIFTNQWGTEPPIFLSTDEETPNIFATKQSNIRSLR